MTMMHPSTKRLLDRLCDMTRQRKISWSETEAGISYQTEGYTVVLAREPASLQLLDQNGRDLETVTPEMIAGTVDEDGRSYSELFDDMFREGARQARGTEEAIDTVLAGLEASLVEPEAAAQESLQPESATAHPTAYEDIADESAAVAMTGLAMADGVGPEPADVERAVVSMANELETGEPAEPADLEASELSEPTQDTAPSTESIETPPIASFDDPEPAETEDDSSDGSDSLAAPVLAAGAIAASTQFGTNEADADTVEASHELQSDQATAANVPDTAPFDASDGTESPEELESVRETETMNEPAVGTFSAEPTPTDIDAPAAETPEETTETIATDEPATETLSDSLEPPAADHTPIETIADAPVSDVPEHEDETFAGPDLADPNYETSAPETPEPASDFETALSETADEPVAPLASLPESSLSESVPEVDLTSPSEDASTAWGANTTPTAVEHGSAETPPAPEPADSLEPAATDTQFTPIETTSEPEPALSVTAEYGETYSPDTVGSISTDETPDGFEFSNELSASESAGEIATEPASAADPAPLSEPDGIGISDAPPEDIAASTSSETSAIVDVDEGASSEPVMAPVAEPDVEAVIPTHAETVETVEPKTVIDATDDIPSDLSDESIEPETAAVAPEPEPVVVDAPPAPLVDEPADSPAPSAPKVPAAASPDTPEPPKADSASKTKPVTRFNPWN